MKGTFRESKELREIIEGHDWLLYDVTRPPREVYTWEELQKQRPAENFVVGRNYLFVPRPKNGQTLRAAYSITQGLGPSLTIVDPSGQRWAGLSVRSGQPPRALFSRLFFEEESLAASSPPTDRLPDPDAVAISYPYVVDTFRRYFRIVKPEEYGLITPPVPPMIDSSKN